MQTIALRPQRKQVTALLAGVSLLVIVMALMPALCLPCGLLLPLFVCPLVGSKRQWVAFAAAIAPALTAALYGQPTLWAFSLLFACGAPVLAAVLLHPKKAATPAAFIYYLAAYGAAVIVTLISLRGLVGGELAVGIARQVTDSMGASQGAKEKLYQMAASGLIAVPPGYEGRSVITYWLDPVLNRQLAMSLRLTLETGIRQLLPTLIVQICLLGGIFTTLRVQRLNHTFLLVDEKHKERVTLAVTPGFSMLKLPKRMSGMLTVMALAGICCLMVDSSWSQQLGLLLYAAFCGCFELMGAAVLVGMLAARKPEAKTAFGALAAALYVLFPTVLMMLGIMDPLFRFRESFQSKKEEKL